MEIPLLHQHVLLWGNLVYKSQCGMLSGFMFNLLYCIVCTFIVQISCMIEE